jgi:streptogramin lyase
MTHRTATRLSRTALAAALLVAMGWLHGSTARADVNLAANSGPYFLTAGPDGNLWFTEHDAGRVGVVSTSGQLLTQYPLPSSYSTPYDIVSGSDRALWFSDPINNQIDRISTDGQMSEFDVSAVPSPMGLVVGPDGALWFASNGSQPAIGRLSTDGNLEQDFIWPDTDWITDVTFGPDGALWMTEGQPCGSCANDKIGRLDGINGSYSSWVLPSTKGYPYRITSGPDGALWFTESVANKIGRITTSGVITEYPLPTGVTGPAGITPGPDRGLWFTTGGDVGRITTTGAITIYPVPGAKSLLGIYAAPDGTLWLADDSASKIIHFSPSAPLGSGCPAYGVVDSRGSGEPGGKLSPLAAAVLVELQARHPGERVADYWNPYPAVGLTDSPLEWANALGAALHIGPLGAYHGSVVDGKRWLRDFISRELRTCPAIKLVLVGYSQGAQVTGDVYQRDVTRAEKRNILAVLLFGDPYFNPSDRRADRGSYDHRRAGALGERRAFGGDPRVESFCHYHDPVCQASGRVGCINPIASGWYGRFWRSRS